MNNCEKVHAYYISLTNGTSIGFITNIDNLVDITRNIMKSKFTLIENKCIDSNKIVFVGRVSEGSLSRRTCLEYLTLITE